MGGEVLGREERDEKRLFEVVCVWRLNRIL